jgi:hypothetical protein
MSSTNQAANNGRMISEVNHNFTTISTRNRINRVANEQSPPLLQRQRSTSVPTLPPTQPAQSVRRSSNSKIVIQKNEKKKKDAKAKIERELKLLKIYQGSFNKVIETILCIGEKKWWRICGSFEGKYLEGMTRDTTSIDAAINYISFITGAMKKQLETIDQSYKILYSEEIHTSNTTMPDTSKKTKPDEKINEFNTLLDAIICKISDKISNKSSCEADLTKAYPNNGMVHRDDVGSAIAYLIFQMDEISTIVQKYITEEEKARRQEHNKKVAKLKEEAEKEKKQKEEMAKQQKMETSINGGRRRTMRKSKHKSKRRHH